MYKVFDLDQLPLFFAYLLEINLIIMILTKTKFIGAICGALLIPLALTSQSTTHTVTLFVNTADITKPDVDAFADFGQDTSLTTNAEFTVSASIGDHIIWRGESSSDPENDIVNIELIRYKRGPRVFTDDDQTGIGESRKLAQGRVSRGNPGDVSEYAVHFTVFNNGQQRNGMFIIDPKIKIE